MTKIGFNLLAWSAVVSGDLLPMAERLKEIGYDGIECFLGVEDKQVYRNFGREIGDLGLEMTCVMVLGPEENPISPSAQVRQKGLDRIKWAVDRADDMDAGLLCGPFHSAFATFHDKSPDEDEYKRSAEVLAKAGEYAAQAGILLAPEAINRFECYLCNTMEQLTYLVEQAAHPNVKAHFDTHHANIEEKKLARAIRKVASVLGHVHICENDRGTPGSGHIPWDETFGALADIGYDGWLTIEAFTRDDPDFANSINVWREYNKPWDVAEQGYAFIKKMCEKHGL
ncbi:D-psicose/D-tagatose/L-ribulose 3-epimerase [Fodinibius roseus]|uniref:D-psicose/D-tagatose/L-ribulose 3-epimerase n=1 Tax=Fodinibius roseus TaxID=1194090 RepID=A0A1M5AX65_9BACT|nr:sugar phosphate isomerase/epimerase family protein [Fodinibius roseus]SHF34864.1 D-psicose/D-tagatose/L-ribulose 3-epimerase [Fodinibius roseus]